MNITKRKKQILAYLHFLTRKESDRKAEKKVYVRMATITPNRRLFQVCTFLIEAGYVCYVDLSFKQFLSMDIYGLKTVYLQKVHSARRSKRQDFDLTVIDDEKFQKNAKTLFLDYSVFTESNEYATGMFFPIHFHPDFMNRTTEKDVLTRALCERKRQISVLFAGNCDKESYNRKETVDFFHVHTRWDIFNYLTEHFQPENMYLPSSYSDFCKARANGLLTDKIVLIDINKFKIPQSDWFDILLDSNFFIHLPGYIQPWCHNQIESMASGAIPVTEFPHIFHPALKGENNAIVYTSREDLLSKLADILRKMPSRADVPELRRNAVSYYKDNLSFDAFTMKLDAFMRSPETTARLYICAGDFSLQA